MAKLKVMNSTIGRSPAKAVPTPSPAKPCSVIGVSITRRSPNSWSRPWLTLYAPWYSPTSSPSRKTVSSRRISSDIASRSASRTVMVRVFPVYSGSTEGTRRGAASDGEGGGGHTSSGASWRTLEDRVLFSTVPTSSPFPAMSAIGVLTATCSVPSGITILVSTPSSIASTSIVALSVSISASTSPARTASPSLLSQRAILPSVIVGDNAGIKTSVAMASRNLLQARSSKGSGAGQDIRPQLGRLRFRGVLRELRRCGDAIPDLAVDLLELRLRRSAFEQTSTCLIDRVVLGAHSVDLIPGTILCRVGHRVSAIPVCHHLEDDRPLAGPGVLSAGKPSLVHGEHVHAVDLLARDPIGRTAMEQVGARRRTIDRRPHPVSIVLYHVNDRQLPQRGHVEALVNLSLVDRPIAEIGDRDLPVCAIMMGKGEPGSDRHLRADDAVAAKEAHLPAEHVHRPALAVRIAATTPGQLGHDAPGIHAAGQHMAVIAIGRDNRVAFLERCLHADDNRFLPDIEVAVTAYQARAVHLPSPLLEPPDQQHVTVVSQQLLWRGADLDEFYRRSLALDGHIASSTRPLESSPKSARKHAGKSALLQPRAGAFKGGLSRFDDARSPANANGAALVA